MSCMSVPIPPLRKISQVFKRKQRNILKFRICWWWESTELASFVGTLSCRNR